MCLCRPSALLVCLHTSSLQWWWNVICMVTKSTRQHLTALITILSAHHQWWMLYQQSVINENAQINFKGSTCQESILMKSCISNAWVMVGLVIMISMMNRVHYQISRVTFWLLKETRQTLIFAVSIVQRIQHINKPCVNFRSGSIQMTFLGMQESQTLIFSTQQWELGPLRSSQGCWGWVDTHTLRWNECISIIQGFFIFWTCNVGTQMW